MYGADEPISDHHKSVRERAAASLGGVRHSLSSPVKYPLSASKDEYSTAVTRLKDLIGQYNQSKLGTRKPPPTQQNFGNVVQGSRTEFPVDNFPTEDDLTVLLNNQFAVVQHLEGQVEFYKDALAALKQRTELLIEENRTLYEQLKSQAAGEILAPDFQQATSEVFLSPKERKFVLQLEDEVDKIRKLHHSKTKHLESLLYSTRDELGDHQRQVSELQAKLRNQEVLGEQHGRPALCVKCAHQEAVLTTGYGDTAMKTMNKMTRDRDELMETLTRQKASLAEVRQRELEAYMQVKKSCEMVEQAQLEKAEAIIQVHQLRDEINSQRQRHEKLMASSHERTAAECEKVRATGQKEAQELLRKVESLAETCNATDNQLERLTREKVSLTSELEQAKAQIMAHSVDMSKATEEVRQELTDSMMKQTMASQDVASLRTAAQQAAREREQEKTRLTIEMSELRRRLQEAEASWVESKEECIRVTENLNQSQREMKTATVARQNSEKARAEDAQNITKQMEEKEQQLAAFIEQQQTRQAQFKMEAENIWEAKKQFTHRVKDECRKLTKKLQETSERSRMKVKEAHKVSEKWRTKVKHAEAEITQKDDTIHELTAKLKNNDLCAKKYAQQVQQLLIKQTNLMRERQMLRLEVEYLRSHMGHVPPLDVVTTASNASGGGAEDDQRSV